MPNSAKAESLLNIDLSYDLGKQGEISLTWHSTSTILVLNLCQFHYLLLDLLPVF
jgi:hypothetical protein